MKKWLKVLLIATLGMFAVSLTTPQPAQALDTGEIILWSAVGTGAAILIVLVATYFTRDESQLFLTEPLDQEQGADGRRVHVGLQCKNPDGTAALLCW